MHIGIDGYEANVSQRVGIGQYAYQLLSHLNQLDKKNQYTVYLPTNPRSDLPKSRQNWQYVIGRPGTLWTLRQLPKLVGRQNSNLDLFFSPTHYSPLTIKLPRILAVMDLSYLHYPEMFRQKDLLQLKYMGGLSIKRAKKILTISKFSKKEIVEHYNYPKEDIVVTYPGINKKLNIKNKMLQTQTQNKIFSKYKIQGRFILFVGTIQPRKNIERLIQAFDTILDKDLQLVIVGKKGWLYEPTMLAINTAKKKEKIIFLEYVDDKERDVLYEKAECLVLASFYEGFGLPVLEAMNYGCVVVVAKGSSLPEVAGSAGIYVDPQSSDSIARGIRQALQLRPEQRRNLIKFGYRQVAKFSWERCAIKTIQVFKEVYDFQR